MNKKLIFHIEDEEKTHFFICVNCLRWFIIYDEFIIHKVILTDRLCQGKHYAECLDYGK